MSKYYCSKCNEDIDKKVYDYSKKKYKKVLCRDCQGGSVKEKPVESNGLSDRQSSYRESMIKGRIAETLIEELFLSLDYNVFRYGMENTVPGVMKLLRGVRGDVAENIKRMPDFVVQHPKTKEVFFIEVKFRKDGEFDKNDKSIRNYPYHNAYFIVVSKKHIKCVTYEELQKGKVVSSESRNWLGNRKEFDLDKDVIIGFCKFAVKFFDKV